MGFKHPILVTCDHPDCDSSVQVTARDYTEAAREVGKHYRWTARYVRRNTLHPGSHDKFGWETICYKHPAK